MGINVFGKSLMVVQQTGTVHLEDGLSLTCPGGRDIIQSLKIRFKFSNFELKFTGVWMVRSSTEQ